MSLPNDLSDDQLGQLCRLQTMYLDGVFAAEDLKALNQLLRSSPAAQRHFVSLCQESSLARELFLAESYSTDAREALATLLKAQPDVAPVNMPECLAHFTHGPGKNAANELAIKRLLSTSWKELICAAAILLIFATAFFFMVDLYSGTQGAAPMTQSPARPDVPPLKVAAITAEENAVWETTAGTATSSVGDALHPGERLTLTTGLALITTQRGAKVTLEGPCTIELIDNTNGLRLIAGKLVAYCPSPSSKGLLVLTPHSQVIDMGTEFGVEAYPASNTDVFVFEGLVAITDLGADPGAAALTMVYGGQGRRIDLQGRMTSLTAAGIADRFEHLIHYADRQQTRLFQGGPLICRWTDKPIFGIACNVAADRCQAQAASRVTIDKKDGDSFFLLNAPHYDAQTPDPDGAKYSGDRAIFLAKSAIRNLSLTHQSLAQLVIGAILPSPFGTQQSNTADWNEAKY